MKYSALLRIVTPPFGALALILLLLLAESGTALVQPWLAGQVTGRILAAEPAGIGWLLLVWLGLIGLRSTIGYFSQYGAGSIGENMAAGLRSRVYEHLQALPMAYYHERRQGETLSLLTRDAETVSQFVTHTLVQLLPHLVTFFGALAMMLSLDALIAGLALVLLPLYYLGMKIVGRRIRPLAAEWIRSWSEMYALTEENLGLMAAIKAFAREPLETSRFAERNRELRHLSRRQIRVQALLSAAVGFLAGGGLLLLVWAGAWHVRSGTLEAADLVSLLLYAMLMTRPISGLASVYGKAQQTRGAAARLLDCFAEQPEPAGGSRALRGVRGAIRFEQASYAYPGRGLAVQDIDLHIEAGETVAIVGPNGAGKSTLAWLLMRFADPASGRVLIDGQDIRDVSLHDLRHCIGLVPQHTLLLNAPVRDNIAYGRPDADQGAIESAARAAGADAFVRALPAGYDTPIGDQGVRLSGGQRQRLALARTLLKDPPIIILDEATSMFDPQGEQDFLAECAGLLAGRTVLMITHRPVSLAIADRVVEMRDGRIESVPPGTA